MAEAVTLLALALAFVVVGYGEWLLLTRARKVPARVVTLFTSVRHDEDAVMGQRDQDLGQKALVRLDPVSSDGRDAKVLLPPTVWGELSEGGDVTVWALPHRALWMRWSPMVRYRQRPIWARLAFGAAVMLVLFVTVGAMI